MTSRELILNGNGAPVWDAIAKAMLQSMSAEERERYKNKYPKAKRLLES